MPNGVMPVRECPLCGEVMRRMDREVTERVPGTSEIKRRKITEWVCPECEYFEEGDGDDAG
jgi:Zn ribbon nucleic-acid-binding protein